MIEQLNEFQKYQFLFSNNGLAAIKAEIPKFKEKYGEKWLAQFMKEFPDFAEIISLAANYEATTAFTRLKQIVEQKIDAEFDSIFQRVAAKTAALTFLDNNQIQILRLHAELQEEIHKPRF